MLNQEDGDRPARTNIPAPGEFPFPFSDTDRESIFLTWVRNHSSYLAVGGFLNWAGAVAAYIRGVLGNLLVLMPILIFLGCALGWFHAPLLDTPLQLSKFAFLTGIVVLLLYFGRDIGKRYATEQSENTLSKIWIIGCVQLLWRWLVKWNVYWNPFWLIDRLWRNLTAWVLIALGFCLLIDLSPQVIEFVRKRAIVEDFGLKECAAAVLGAISAVGGLLQLLPKSKSIVKNVIVVIAAILSLGIVWGITLKIANYFYYGLPPHGWFMYSLPFICLGLLVLSQFVRVWNSNDVGMLRRIMASAGLAFCLLAGLVVATLFASAFKRQAEYSADALGTISRPLARLVNGIRKDSIESFDNPETGSMLTILSERKANLDSEGPQLFASSSRVQKFKNLEVYYTKTGQPPVKILDFADRIREQTGGEFALFFGQPDRVTISSGGSPEVDAKLLASIQADTFLPERFQEITGRKLPEMSYIEWQSEEDALAWTDAYGKFSKAATTDAFWERTAGESNQLIKIEQNPANKTLGTPPKEDTKPTLVSTLKPIVSRLVFLSKGEPFPTGYYERTSLFLEEAQRLGGINNRQRNKLLRELSSTATSSVLSLADEKKPPSQDFERIVLDRLLATKLSVSFDSQSVDDFLSGSKADFETQLSSPRLLIAAKEWIGEARLPLSLASEYLDRIPHRSVEKEQFKDSTAPDAAFTGPKLIGDSWLKDDATLKPVIAVSLLRVLLSSVGQDKGKQLLDKLEDSWFETHRVTKGDFTKFMLPTNKGRKLTFGQIVEVVLRDEEAIHKTSIREWCGIGDKEISSSDVEISEELIAACRWRMLELALSTPAEGSDEHPLIKSLVREESKSALHVLAELFDPQIPSEISLDEDKEKSEEIANSIYLRRIGQGFSAEELAELAAARFIFSNENNGTYASSVLRRIVHGRFGSLNGIEDVGEELFRITWFGKFLVLATIFVALVVFCWLFINPNSTSLHGFYKRKLADAFVVNCDGDNVFPERGIRLSDLSDYQSGSTAPYHLINVAINMQGSDNPNLRDRNADFFVFSKNYIGGESTGYLATEEFESAASDVTAATAMAVSAGAASPNMGQYTISMLSFLLTMVNLRLGYWIPNPKNLAAASASKDLRKTKCFEEDVFTKELKEILERRKNAYCAERECSPPIAPDRLSTCNQLMGMALSGGGIRSAAVNLGNVQVLNNVGLFKEIDYLSTVSGGGYLGTSLSTLMRKGFEAPSPDVSDSTMATVEDEDETSDSIAADSPGEEPQDRQTDNGENRRASGQPVKIQVNRRKRWRPGASLLLREMVSMLHGESKWINVSDGGHVENLGAFELLRRRCAMVIVGEGECDAVGKFPGLSTLMRLAEIDLNVKIDFPKGSLEKLILPSNFDALSGEELKKQIALQRHFAVARIRYPKKGSQLEEFGYLLYVRSSLRGDEDQILQSYRKSNPAFPNESTADQMFNEGQFEAYRRLGVKMMQEAVEQVCGASSGGSKIHYKALRSSLESWWKDESQEKRVK